MSQEDGSEQTKQLYSGKAKGPSAGQEKGDQFGFIEAAPVKDAEPESEHRTTPAPARWEGKK